MAPGGAGVVADGRARVALLHPVTYLCSGRTLQRQLPAVWVAGFIVALLTGGGYALRLLGKLHLPLPPYLVLVTANTNEFQRVKGLVVEDWTV